MMNGPEPVDRLKAAHDEGLTAFERRPRWKSPSNPYKYSSPDLEWAWNLGYRLGEFLQRS